MEEKKETKDVSAKLTYEQLEEAALQLQQRVIMVENKLKSIDFVSMRLAWLFKVIENQGSFTQEFVNKCVKEAEGLLTLEDTTPNNEVPEEQKDKVD